MKKLTGLEKLIPYKIHQKGAVARENDDHLLALQYLDYAIVGYQKRDDYRGVIDALKDRTLTWKHYFLLTKDSIYYTLAMKDAESMLEIAKEKKLKDKFSTSYFRIGEISMLKENFSKAIESYLLSLKYYKGKLSEKGDFRYHLGEALYRSGQKSKGERVILQGLKEIQKGAKNTDSFLIHVWESGCYGRLADLLKEDKPKEAINYLKKAKAIINSDKRLVIRKRQIKGLEDEFKKLKLL